VSDAANVARPAGRVEPRQAFSVAAGRWGLRIGFAGEAPVGGPKIDAACVGTLALAVFLQGIAEGLGLPGKVQLLTDIASLALLIGLVVVVLRAGSAIRVPYLVCALGVVIVVAALRSDELLRLLVAARNLLLLPALALALGSLAPSEDRARRVVLTIFVLSALEFLITIPQALIRNDVDLVVGTYGDYAGPSLAFALLAGTALLLGAVAAGRLRWPWLLAAVIVPMFSVWAAIRGVPVMLPLVGLAVAPGAWWASRNPSSPLRRRVGRGAIIVLASVLATVAVFAAYAQFRPTDFALFTDSGKRSHYLETGDLALPTPPPQPSNPAAAPQGPFVPGRGDQYRTAFALVDGSPASFLFGNGLGSTTYAVNLGLDEPPTAERIAGYSDFGSAIVELGWLGVGLIGLSAAMLCLACISAARKATAASWRRALLIAYPGVLVAMALSGMLGSPFRNAGSATMFWLLTGLVLASVQTDSGPRARIIGR
jgi:hypothetical protein